MALSADEQRALAEIERRLATDDPGLATCLTAFRRPGPARVLRSPRARIIGSLFTVLLVAMVSLMVYAMIPFRTHGARTPATRAREPRATCRSRPPGPAVSRTATRPHRPAQARARLVPPRPRHPSAGQSAGTGQAKPTGNQAADQVASPVTGP